MLTVLVVVTHLGLLVLGAGDLGGLDGLLRDLHVLLESRARNGGVNGELVDLGGGLVLGRARRSAVNGEVVVLGLLGGLVLGAGRASFNSEVVDLSLLVHGVTGGAGGVDSEVVDFSLLVDGVALRS